MLRGLVQLIRHMDGLSGPEHVDVIERLLRAADVSRQDMLVACKFNDQHYARNVLAKSPWYQLIVICWRYGQSSPIHDHGRSACGVRVVDGVATERRYEPDPGGEIVFRDKRTFRAGEVCTTSESDIHVITNQEPDAELVTLHLYTPPLAMKFYDEPASLDTPAT